MTPPLDLDSLRRQHPDMPGWGERLFTEIYALRGAVESKAAWSPKDIAIIAGAFTAALAGLTGAGVV